MYPFILALLLILTGILVFRHYSNYIHRNKLPPGPSPLPVIGNLHLIGNHPHRSLHKLSQQYGPIMSIRVGSVQVVVISSPDAVKLFLGTHDTVFATRPKLQAGEYFAYGYKGMTFTEYGAYLRSVKKLCIVELLSAAKINGFAGLRREEIGLMVEGLRDAAAACAVVNMSETAGRFIENITCRMLFGRNSDERFVSLLDEGMEILGRFNLADYLPILAPFDLQGLTQRVKSLTKKYDEMLETLIKEHEEVNGTRFEERDQMDFIDILLSLKHKSSNTHVDPSYEIDNSVMKAILLDILAGTIDTVKASIEWTLSALIRNPRVMKKLQQELNTVVGDKQVVDETDLTKLSYLHMVIKETFRLYPTAPFYFPHESLEDVVINGYNIPKKTQLIVNYWAFGRDPKVWSENWEEFLPERFLHSEIGFRGPDFQIAQFSTGRRGCPGMNLALVNIGLVVSNLVYCFDWELPNGMSPGDLDMNEKFGLTIPKVKPLEVIPTYRL